MASLKKRGRRMVQGAAVGCSEKEEGLDSCWSEARQQGMRDLAGGVRIMDRMTLVGSI